MGIGARTAGKRGKELGGSEGRGEEMGETLRNGGPQKMGGALEKTWGDSGEMGEKPPKKWGRLRKNVGEKPLKNVGETLEKNGGDCWKNGGDPLKNCGGETSKKFGGTLEKRGRPLEKMEETPEKWGRNP